MRKIFFFLLSLVLFFGAPASSRAHFLWVAAHSQTKDGKVHVYFSDAASPDDPSLLDKVTHAKVWQIARDGNATLLKTSKDADSLVADPVEEADPSFILSHEYGVTARGNETFLLKYHAKCHPSPKPQTWQTINKTDQLPLEIVARMNGEQIVLTILWQGKPLNDSTVTVVGPGIESKLEATSNQQGEVSFGLKSSGLYSIRAKHTEATPGEWYGKAFSSIRHYATLALSAGGGAASAPTTSLAAPVSAWPALDPGLTSFGAALVGDELYVYGGHFGKPHHYSKVGQSDQLLRLNVKQPAKWEVVSTGPRRTGLAAVSYDNKFYRIGGFEARNEEAEKQSLWSMTDFACFDPKSGTWQQLPALPKGRSSHDALVIGSTLYVVGGWELKGEENPNWHDSAYTVDLAAATLEWKELPKPPFLRRAISLGEWQGKVVAIGGMQPEGGPTTATAIFDPKSQVWSEGPKLNGEPMEGFGTSAFLCHHKLCVTTLAGNLQILSADGSRWVNSGKLTHPRFFHRMLPLNASQALIIGGASMKTGKIHELEILEIGAGSAGD
jgi:uncharacterized GH25 family protein